VTEAVQLLLTCLVALVDETLPEPSAVAKVLILSDTCQQVMLLWRLSAQFSNTVVYCFTTELIACVLINHLVGQSDFMAEQGPSESAQAI